MLLDISILSFTAVKLGKIVKLGYFFLHLEGYNNGSKRQYFPTGKAKGEIRGMKVASSTNVPPKRCEPGHASAAFQGFLLPVYYP